MSSHVIKCGWRPAVLCVLALVAATVFAAEKAETGHNGSASNAGHRAAKLSNTQIEWIEHAVSREMSRQGIPGLSIAIALDNHLVWSNGFGLADLENYVPVKTSTVYRLASVSKPVTAMAVMQLLEQGKIDLDAPIQKYVPTFPKKRWPITVRQLLAHTSGIRHYKGTEFASVRRYKTLHETLEIFKDDPLVQQPGSKFSYTTYGYNLLGCAVENMSGKKFPEYLRDHIFQPAGMDRARTDDHYAIIPNRASGYRKTKDGYRNSMPVDTSNKIPGGGLCATVVDLVHFGVAVQSGKLAHKKTVRQMFTVASTNEGGPVGEADSSGKFVGHGLGWFVRTDKRGREVIRYGGSQPTVRSLLYMLPKQHYTVAVMCNLEGVDLDTLAAETADISLGVPRNGSDGTGL